MDAYVLPSSTYVPGGRGRQYTVPSPQDRRPTINSIIEDYRYSSEDEQPLADLVKRTLVMSLSPQSDNFPTPKASLQPSTGPSSSAPWMKSRSDPEFDDLYDVTDDEGSEMVPLKCSESVRKTKDPEEKKKNRYPSIVIPSPSAWPTIQKLQQQQKSAGIASPLLPTPPAKIAPSPEVLSMIAARRLTVPDRSATPSLDGSLTSEEMDKLSCPSTPDTHSRRGDREWDAPVQLNPEAMATLHYISGHETEGANPVIEIGSQEMQEVPTGTRQPTLDIAVTPVDSEEDPLSALSVPSPGGFFSSLGSSARHTWSFPRTEETPNTSTAENFYGVPWAGPPNDIVEQVVEVGPSMGSGIPSGPSTARWVPEKKGQVTNVYEYNENYERELAEMASANIDRTSLWINAQENYMAVLRSPKGQPSPAAHGRKDSGFESIDEIVSPSKKSVRFIDGPQMSPASIGGALSPKKSPKQSPKQSPKETIYLEGFEHYMENSHRDDAVNHGQSRAEALHLERRCLPLAHKDQLMGRMELTAPARPSPRRPTSHFYPEGVSESEYKEVVARAQKERQALEQIRPAVWNLEALKALQGGHLVSPAAAKWLSRPASNPIRILDIGGQPTCDWAWQMALDFPHAAVYNVTTKAQQTCEVPEMTCPENYHQVTVPNLWTLPFPAGHFDVVSARALHALLKVHRPTFSTSHPTAKVPSGDEYDLCLSEAERVLKKGGYLEYALLDAEIVHDTGLHSPGGDGSDVASPSTCRTSSTSGSSRASPSRAQALGIEFAFNLRTRGYDPQPTKKFVPRLRRAGFASVKRAWMVLPMPATEAIAKPSPFVAASRPSLDSVRATDEPQRTISANGDVQDVLVGRTADASVVAGLVGARAWESWMLKLQMETGKDEQRLLEGVGEALEEGAGGLAGWRYLTGWARKAW